MRVEAHRLDGPRPPQWVLRCRADGLKPPVKLQWRFPAGVKQIGWGVPQDEETELVQPPENVASWAECSATGDDGVVIRATHSMVPLAVTSAPSTARAGELITVRGAGFGPSPTPPDHAIWLVPARGAAVAVDLSCKGAAWNDASASGCVPAVARGRTFGLRVQANEELAIAPAPLVVAK